MPKSKTKMSRELEKLIAPIVLDFAKQLEVVFKQDHGLDKKDRYVANLLKDAASLGSKR